jgi:hypothetical protein
MFLFRLGGAVIKWGLAGLALAGAVTPFYFYAAWHEMSPPEPMRSFVGPVLGPGLVTRALLGGHAGEASFRLRLLGHAAVILGSTAFWLMLLAGLQATFRWLSGDRSRRSPGRPQRPRRSPGGRGRFVGGVGPRRVAGAAARAAAFGERPGRLKVLS